MEIGHGVSICSLALGPDPKCRLGTRAQGHKGTMNKGSSCSVNAFTSIRADSSVKFCVLCRLTECSLCRERLMVLCWADKAPPIPAVMHRHQAVMHPWPTMIRQPGVRPGEAKAHLASDPNHLLGCLKLFLAAGMHQASYCTSLP